MYGGNTFYEYSTPNCGMGVHRNNDWVLKNKKIKIQNTKTKNKKRKTNK